MSDVSTGGAAPAYAPVLPPRPPRPGRALAVTALALAIGGVVAAFTPLAIAGAALLVAPALVLAVVALARRGRGTGTSIAALVLALVGGAVTAVGVVGYFSAPQPTVYGSPYTIDEPAAPTGASDDDADPSAALEPLALAVGETASGRVGQSSTWWFVAIVDAADRGAAAGVAAVEVDAISPDGEVLQTFSTYRAFLPGRTAVAGFFSDLAGAEVAEIAVSDPLVDPRYDEPVDACGGVEVSDAAASSDPGLPTTVAGELSVDRDGECLSPGVVVVARDAEGAILEAATGWATQTPADGDTVTFEASFLQALPADAVFETYPLP
ncbi:hypothetical protein [Microbacterium sp. NPDC055683]